MRFSYPLLMLLCGALTIACDEPADDDDDDIPGLTDPNDEVDTESPVITGKDAWCYSSNVGQVRYYWVVQANVEDPQGVDTLVGSDSTVTVYTGTNKIYDASMTCDDEGLCSTNWIVDDANMYCDAASAGQYTFEIIIADEDGNFSEPINAYGRIGDDAGG